MEDPKLNKIKLLIRKHKNTAPKTFYDELAEKGLLYEYLTRFKKNEFENDKKFRNEMFDLMATKSNSNQKEIEIHYMETLIESLSFFQEYTKS